MPDFNPEKSRDVFSWGDIQLRQTEEVLKVGTDAILLGSWTSRTPTSPEHVLDIGCGTGILALMMAQVFPDAIIDAIDIHPEALRLARENFLNSQWKERLHVKNEDVLQYDAAEQQYDLIIINPPYYPSDYNVSMNESRRISRHSKDSPHSWMMGLHRRLNTGGEIRLVIPYQQASNWINAANQIHLYAVERVDVYSFVTDDEPKRTLLCFRRSLVKPFITQLIMYQSPDVTTLEYRTFISR